MKGRFERQLIIEEQIKRKLKDMPVFMTMYYEDISKKECRTVQSYVNYVYNFIKFLNERGYNNITIENIKEIKPTDINAYMKSISVKEVDNEKKENSTSYLATVWSAINNFFEFLLINGYITDNPCIKTSRPKVKDKISDVSMNPDEISQFLNGVIDGVGSDRAKARQKGWKERDKLIMVLFIESGIRAMALDTINISDVDLEKETILITDKGSDSYEYKLHASTVVLMKEWLEVREQYLDGKKCEALFISNQKKRISYGALKKLTLKYGNEVGKHITPHKIRHSYGTNLYEATHDIDFVQKSLRHAFVTTTQRYVNTGTDAKAHGTEIMAEIVSAAM